MNLLAKVALGSTHQVVTVSGTTTVTTPSGATQTATGGLLALDADIGQHAHDVFSVIPEGQAHPELSDSAVAAHYVGYSFLYWSDVVRPGDQVVRTVNETQLPTSQNIGPLVGPAQPAFPFRQTSFWAQGIDFGLSFRF